MKVVAVGLQWQLTEVGLHCYYYWCSRNSRIEFAVVFVAVVDVGEKLVSYLRELVVGVHFLLRQWRPA